MLLPARPTLSHVLIASALLIVIAPQTLEAQGPASDAGAANAPSVTIQIPDEPKSVDPATLVPKPLSARASVRFAESSLSDVAKWIQQQTQINVSLDRRSLQEAQILPSEPVVDELKDAPVYLLLDRLKNIGINWRLSDGVIHLTAMAGEPHVNTVQYNVGDLFDAGHVEESLRQTILETVDAGSWDEAGGVGGIVVLGDVLFVRQTNENHRRVAGLLAALRKHGRRTLIYDPPQHAPIRQALQRNVTTQFRDKPLGAAVEELANVAKIDIRLDRRALKDSGIPERLPISIEINDQSLRVALDLMLQPNDLTWQLRDGALWITTRDSAESQGMTAVFDVRDLCRGLDESESLRQAITSQSDPDGWSDAGGIGEIRFPIAGAMVVYQTERHLDDVLQLLENYRTALRASKRRVRAESDPKAVVTRYYRMPSVVADDLETALPELIRAETWKSATAPNAPGTIRKISSWIAVGPTANPGAAPIATVPYSVLVIDQMREVHDELPKIFQRIEHGEAGAESGGAGMGGMGGGGFGGGYFFVPTK